MERVDDRDRFYTDTDVDPAEPVGEERGRSATVGAIGGAVAGAVAGTLIAGPVGTAVGAAAGAVGGAALGAAAADAEGGIGVAEGPGVVPVGGLGSGTMAMPMGAAATSGPGAAGVGELGLPTASSETNIERQTGDAGPFDNPASYDETAADIGKERNVLVGDDPGFDAASTDGDRSQRDANDLVRDRDELAQGGPPN